MTECTVFGVLAFAAIIAVAISWQAHAGFIAGVTITLVAAMLLTEDFGD